MPVSISRWNAPPRAPRAIQAAMVCSSPSAGVSRCSLYASNRSARAGVKTSTGRAMPAARSSAPSSVVATPYPQGASGSNALETATAPTPYAFALTTGRSRVPATRATVRAFSMTAARSTSTQARLSRPRIDTLTGARIIPRPAAQCKAMKRLGEPMPNDAALARALALVRDLRARCPWDRAQTAATLRPYLVEEVLELDQALKTGNPAEVRDELGDLLLHLAFQI